MERSSKKMYRMKTFDRKKERDQEVTSERGIVVARSPFFRIRQWSVRQISSVVLTR